MHLKPEVQLINIQPEIFYAIGVAATLHRNLREGDITVTSLNDSTHKHASRHYTGKAVDLRTKHLTPGQTNYWLIALREHLEPFGFDVFDEQTHFHIQFNPTAARYLYVRI